MKKIQMKVISLILGAGIVISSVPALSAQAAPNSAIAETKRQIMAMTESIQKQEVAIAELSEKITLTGEEILAKEAEIVTLNGDIDRTNQEITSTRETLGEKEELYGKRLREVYKNGNTTLIGALLGATDLSDLLLRLKAVENIARHDQDLIQTITGLKVDLEEKARTLEANRSSLETATADLKTKQEELTTDKASQENQLTGLQAEKTRLRELLSSQEVALFADIEAILASAESTEAEVKEALAILDTIQSQVSSAEAVALGKQLAAKGRTLAEELKAARLEAERLAREKAEAERLARELEAKRLAAEKLKEQQEARRLAEERRQAAQLAAQKEKDRQAALARAKALEAKQAAAAAEAAKLKAAEDAAKEAAAKAKQVSATQPKSTTSPKPTESSGTNNLTFYLSFYTDLPEHNGGWTITATGEKLTYGVVANNVWPLYTKIYLEGYGTMTVKDRGGAHFYNRYRLDVFIPRKSGETNAQYTARVWDLGRRTVKGRILK